MDLCSLAGVQGKQGRQVAEHLLRKGYYDYVGTDVHKLSEYEKGLRTLRLSGEQVRLVRKLLDNNEMLLK